MEPPGQSVPGTPRFHDDDDRVIIEPLPDITVKRSSGNKYGKPMDYNHVVNKGLNVDDWFHGKLNQKTFRISDIFYDPWK